MEGGAPGRIRTRDLVVRSHSLYPLSYRRADNTIRPQNRRVRAPTILLTHP